MLREEMLDLILDTAKADERIRAVILEGSRADPNAVKDEYQDYDINFFVSDVRPFLEDRNWIYTFGEPLIIQEPDLNDLVTGFFGDVSEKSGEGFLNSYAFLMLFKDRKDKRDSADDADKNAVRIDLTLIHVDNKALMEKNGEPVIVLLDKDKILPSYPKPTDLVYHIKKPSEDMFKAVCNEFWWCINNVIKGIARNELVYAAEMLNHYVRDMLNKMIDWKIGIENDFSVSAGKMGRNYKRLLPSEIYKEYMYTYQNDIRAAMVLMCDLFRKLALFVSDFLGFRYNENEENGIREYMKMVLGI